MHLLLVHADWLSLGLVLYSGAMGVVSEPRLFNNFCYNPEFICLAVLAQGGGGREDPESSGRKGNYFLAEIYF